jgi:short-subunit dehydrogenase
MTQPKPTALVTGASGGIGLELARLCAKDGHDLVLVARNEGKLQEVAKYLHGMYRSRVEIVPADLGQPGAARAVMQAVDQLGLGVDVLINNAGFGQWGLFGRGDPDQILAMIQVNITCLTELTRLALPRMVTQRWGRVLNVASTAAFAPGPLMGVYYATKAYVLSFSQAVGNELRGTGVTVTALCPGPTRTGFAGAAGLNGTNLFEGPNVMDVQPVALAGYRGMLRGRAVVVPGLFNRLLVFSIRLFPRWTVLQIARWFQERRAE